MRKIYEATVKTVIWLRGSSARSKQCFRSIASRNVADLFSDLGDRDMRTRRPQSFPKISLDDLCVLACPQWWSGVWVIPELVVCKNAVSKAGLDELPWSKLEFPTKEMKWALALDI